MHDNYDPELHQLPLSWSDFLYSYFYSDDVIPVMM